MNKWVALLQSRKFWTLIIGTAVSVGLLEFSDNEQATLVEALIIIAAAIGYSASVAVEDGLTKIAEAQRLTKIQDVLRDYSQRKGV